MHDRGRVLTDVAVTIADGGTRIGDIATVGDHEELFGSVASAPTAWRTLHEASGRLDAVAAARAAVRAHVWDQLAARHGKIPPCRIAGTDLGDTVVVRLDSTIVIAHSEKEQATRTGKKTFGHHPLTAWCDNTGECLVIQPRPGNAGANTTTDHVEVVDAAIAQIPAPYRGNLPVTVDGAGSTHGLVDHLSALDSDPAHPDRRVRSAVGFDLDDRVRTAIGRLPSHVWCPAVDADGEPRPHGEVAEVTGPADMRVIVRRERPHPGAQLSLFEQHEGYRFPVTATTVATGQVPFREACHRAQARVESRIRWERTPACAGGHPRSSRSPARGAPRSGSPATCWPGWGCSRSTATWRRLNRRRSAPGCCTPLAGSCVASGAAG